MLAHSVSVMTVQAGAVRRQLTPEQEREREALLTVEETGRQALAEMRRLLGIMRTRRRGGRRWRRSRGSRRCRSSSSRCAGRGCRSSSRVEGTPIELPAGVDLSAYRIVQEALTNTLKHAGDAHAWVAVRWDRRGGRDRGRERRRGETESDGGGHGLVGMRERAALCGGELAVGPAAGRRLHDLGAPAGGGIRVSVRVLIVDDQALVRAGFRMILESEPEIEIVGEADDGLEAVEAARSIGPTSS